MKRETFGTKLCLPTWQVGLIPLATVLLLTFLVSVKGWSADATRLLLIGDSLSGGYGLSGPGWVEQINLAQNGKISIINDSITGDTTAGGVARIREGIEKYRPDWVMIQMGGNDGLRALPPKQIKRNLRKMVDIAAEYGIPAMILGIRIPPNYGQVYTEQFAGTFEQVAEETGAPLLPYFIGEVGGDPDLNLNDGVHPNDAAQPIIRDRVLGFILSVLDSPTAAVVLSQ